MAQQATRDIPDRGQSLLDVLRSQSHVDIDSLDCSSAKALGPFTDCTSNQAIAFAELSLHRHHGLLQQAAKRAHQERAKYLDVSLSALAVDIAMVMLALQMEPYLTGRFHIQANPADAYSTSRTVLGGERLVALACTLDPTFESNRVCIKVPSTWEGLLACKELETKGIHTLATTPFTMEQAVLAAEVGATYIAPYVNDLKVHFEAGYVDPTPNLQLCVDIQRYYLRYGFRTQVLPASLTSVKEVMALAGAQHITIPPALLQALKDTPASADTRTAYPSLYHKPNIETDVPAEKFSYLNDEAGYRLAVTRRDGGRQEKKLIDAINIFYNMQVKLEELMSPLLDAADGA